MYDPKFEKAVKQKMEELEFPPAESVWANIEKAVADRRRRRGLFFWRFLLPGMVLVAAAGVYYFAERKAAPALVKAAPVGAAADKAVPVGSGAAAITKQGTTGSSAAANIDGATGSATTAAATHLNGTAVGNRLTGSGIAKITTRVVTTGTAPGRKGRSTIAQTTATTGRPEANATRGMVETDAARGAIATTDVSTGTDDVLVTVIEPEGRFVHAPLPGLADQRNRSGIRAAALVTKKATTSLVVPSQKRPWEAGFAGGVGSSKLNRLNADKAAAALNNSAASFYSITGSYSSKSYISNVQPDISYYAGIYLQKQLSKRWTFNTGMNLQYYSSRLTVGQQIKTYVQPAYSLLVSNTAPGAANATLYSVGDQQTYTNRYYFLEVPVAMQWKVNRSRILPIFLEGGLSLSRLMSANALFYDARTGIYTKDGSVVNKTQLNLSSAMMVGLPFHGIHIQVGPQVQYGLLPLVNNQSLGDQHFFYTGVRLVVLPGRR